MERFSKIRPPTDEIANFKEVFNVLFEQKKRYTPGMKVSTHKAHFFRNQKFMTTGAHMTINVSLTLNTLTHDLPLCTGISRFLIS